MATTKNGDNARSAGSVKLAIHIDLLADQDGGCCGHAPQQPPPKTSAYAYSPGGKLLASKAVNERGDAELSIPVGREDAAVRLLVGPTADPPDLPDLQRRGALEQHLRLSLKEPRQSLVIPVDPGIWRCWILRRCLVQGTLLKRVMSGGVALDLPVCNASVDIWEVDPWWILVPRLPPWLVDWLRRVVAGPVTPGPGDPVEGIGARVELQAAAAADPVPVALRQAMRPERAESAATGDALLRKVHVAAQGTELRTLAEIGSDLAFRNALAQNAALVMPLFCWFYPRFVTKQKIATATTDHCGHFRTAFFRSCRDPDVPDLYFSARQRIFGWFDLTIYEPTPVACHTWWNYVCGTPVTLITTHPLAMTCAPCQPVIAGANWVLFTAIGNTSLKAIYGGGAAGATAGNVGLLETGAPWGGTLRPRLDFDNALRDTLGVRYYQLAWRKGTSGNFTPLNRDVARHYAHMVGTDPVLENYPLGPHHMVVGSETLELYEIPPALPPVGQWTVANAVLDTENGEFDSVAFSSGLAFNPDGSVVAGTTDASGFYQIKLDLYDAAGQQIDIGAKGIAYYVPADVNLSGTIHTVNANTIAQPGGGTLVQGNSLVLTLHVDNNHCWAGIGAPATPAGSADPCCGVLHYAAGQSVTMPYVAYHPHGFATYDFTLVRSATQILPTVSGGVGSFTLTRTVHDLMTLALPAACQGKPECTTAAFGERLNVYETATDGWGSYLGYNAYDVRAFALATS